MTREEAINVLKKYEVYGCGVCLQDDLQNNLDANEALDMAIKSLSAESSGDLISRADLMKEFAERVKESNNSDYIEPPNWNDAVSLVGSMPSVSADRPSGEWVVDEKHTDEVYTHPVICSVCGQDVVIEWGEFTPFCPNCGADMRGDK